ncbi:unnamed protein product [Clavelina lepadiformis]|uniref:Glutaredoxin domain-containing protein n=1 Tax=Clavelina lepadiformis TaxID=159417 RepID=A0ABP0FEQ4_CLALP
MVYKGKTQPNLLPVIGADCLLTNFLEKNIVSTFSRWNGTTVDANNTGSQEHIDSLLKKNKVVVFMKGIPSQPMCGFSNAVVQILRMHGVEYDSYNVLEDDALRSGIKEYSDWPTIPQVYMNGEFIDINHLDAICPIAVYEEEIESTLRKSIKAQKNNSSYKINSLCITAAATVVIRQSSIFCLEIDEGTPTSLPVTSRFDMDL